MGTAFAALVAAVDDLAPRSGVPGVAAAVFGPHGTEFHGHGTPVVDDPRPVTADTVFQIGSVSKPLAALAVHSLVAEGRFALDDHVGDLIGRDDLPTASVRQLLGHQAGVDGDVLLTNPPERPDTTAAVEMIANGARLGLVGGEPSYSNAAYTLLAAVAENATGESFADVLRAKVTRPLRMRRTFTTADEAISHVVALPHQSHGDTADLMPGGAGWQRRWELAAYDAAPAGVIASTADLVAFGRFVLGLDQPTRAPVPVDALPALWERQALIAPDEWTGGGFLVDGSRTADVVHHPGVTAGYGARLTLVPELSIGVVVLTNATAGGQVADAITDTVLDAAGVTTSPQPSTHGALPDVATDALAPGLTGRYSGGLGITTIEATGPDTVTLTHEPHSDDRWQPFPDPPWEGRVGSSAIHGTGDDHSVPFGVESGRRWIRWNRRLRIS